MIRWEFAVNLMSKPKSVSIYSDCTSQINRAVSSSGCHRRLHISLHFLIYAYAIRQLFRPVFYISTQTFMPPVSFGVRIGVNGVWFKLAYRFNRLLSAIVQTGGQALQPRRVSALLSHLHRCSVLSKCPSDRAHPGSP